MTKSEIVNIGTKFETFTMKVELGKAKELALAIGDDNPMYQTGEQLPPTFPTVIDYWGSQSSLVKLLGLNLEKSLHGGQEYEYLKKIQPGDEITVTTEVIDFYTKKSMDFYVVKREYLNQQGETVVICRSTIIERH